VEQRRADINSQTSQGAVVKALMEARQRGEIDGIHGRLGEQGGCQAACHCSGARRPCTTSTTQQAFHISSSTPPTTTVCRCCVSLLPPSAGDLGAIAREYDIAVSTSCPALDYIVVDTTSAAQRCVELLRQRQLGVATFLILEKQQHLVGATKEKKQAPEGGLKGGQGVQWGAAWIGGLLAGRASWREAGREGEQLCLHAHASGNQTVTADQLPPTCLTHACHPGP
jgi:structural maintenance of chromosome 4